MGAKQHCHLLVGWAGEVETDVARFVSRVFLAGRSAISACVADPRACAISLYETVLSVAPTASGAKFVLSFMGVALLLERFLPGKVETGPETATGHIPQ